VTDDPAERWIRDLSLVPHPEGGFYRETQRGSRCTTIVYLLPRGGFSAWHRLHGADEVWHFYAGDPLDLFLLDDAGLRQITLGVGGEFHGVVPAGTWQAARPRDGGYALVGCTVAPPFTFERFEMADRTLPDRWPQERERIAGLLRRE
jgi:uncharacterized protein